MSATDDLLEEAARLAEAHIPSEPLSPAMAACMVPTLLEQRARLARALLAAHPGYRRPHHQRPPRDETA